MYVFLQLQIVKTVQDFEPFQRLDSSAKLKDAQFKFALLGKSSARWLLRLHSCRQLQLLSNLTRMFNLEAIETSDDEHRYYLIGDSSQQRRFEDALYKLAYSFVASNHTLRVDAGTGQAENARWTRYHSLDDIYEWEDLQAEKHPALVTPYTIGHSYEGRPIKALKVSQQRGNKAIFIECNIHAIEWISSATCTCFLDKLLISHSEEMLRIRTAYDWIVVPMLNSDGFVYTHEVTTLWRKNRKPTAFSDASQRCYGTDLNRNFGYNWKVPGYNNDEPCDYWYAGDDQDSEPDVQALQRFINSFNDGYMCIYLLNISKAFADAVRRRYSTEFTFGASRLLNYAVSGSDKDWAYAVKGMPFSATVELRDKGQYGFFLLK